MGPYRDFPEERPKYFLARCAWHTVLLCFLAVVLMRTTSHCHAEVASVGVVKNVIGELTVVRGDGRLEMMRGPGAVPLFAGDELRTGPGAKALIEFHDGTRCALNERTTFTIQSRWRAEAGIVRVLRMVVGEVWVNTGAQPAALEVETPVASASIKGTEFNIKVFPDGRSELTVVHGVVAFGTAFGTCPIPGGSTSVGEQGKKCTKPVAADVAPTIAWIEEIAQ